MNAKILSLGDCNTLGIKECEGNAYPEQFAQMIGAESKNCGFTMSTLREAKHFFHDFYDSATNIVTIQYGLVDSWITFRHAPYVLYYPDNFLRKISRKVVKKYKKTCRQKGLNEKFGTKQVVPPDEFYNRLIKLIASCRSDTHIFLIETVPNNDESRNPNIQKYNALLKDAALSDSQCILIETYDYFFENKDVLYMDNTHMNVKGHEYIARKLFELYTKN